MNLIKGKAWKYGDDVNTDDIIPARYLNTTDEKHLADHCMEHLREDFSKLVDKGDIIVAGANFGCGSSREHAPLSIKALGISCVVAVSFARIFYRNSFNIGLPIFETNDAEKISKGDVLVVDYVKGYIENKSKSEKYQFSAVPDFMQKLVESGGLMEYAKRLDKEK